MNQNNPPDVAPLADRLAPTYADDRYHLGTRHGNEHTGRPELGTHGAVAWMDMWESAQWIQGHQGAWPVSIAIMERVGPWMDNMLQFAYEAGRADVASELTGKMFELTHGNPYPLTTLDRGRDGRNDEQR